MHCSSRLARPRKGQVIVQDAGRGCPFVPRLCRSFCRGRARGRWSCTASVVEFALQRQGIIEPSPLNIIVGRRRQAELIIDQLTRSASCSGDGTPARVGIGAAKRNADGTGAVVFALQTSGRSTAPIPRSVPANGNFTVDAVVDARYQ
jgi:hypothetical protein